MFSSSRDVGGVFIAVGIVLAVLTIIIAAVESLVLSSLKWDRFRRCLLAASLMNILSTIFGGGLIALIGWTSATIWLPVSHSFQELVLKQLAAHERIAQPRLLRTL